MRKADRLKRRLADAQKIADQAQAARLKALGQLSAIRQREQAEGSLASPQEQNLRDRMPAIEER